jgi:peptidoglycan/xylan/chitin deacetylase (PgdA/CDA1 family)
VFLSHDVDWGKSGPPISHIVARKERFDEGILENCRSSNLYYNFDEYMRIEDRFGVKSTFFFRTYVKDSIHSPPSYYAEEYQKEIRTLLKGGWEIGLHMDPASYASIDKIRKEKRGLEEVTGQPVYGNRVHYTMNNDILHANLQELSFKYDASAKTTRERIVDDDFGYFRRDRLLVFPITVMDALMFAYIAKEEKQVVDVVRQAVNRCRGLPKDKRVMTIIWHDCALKMKKGRRYPDVLKYLASVREVEMVRGIDLVERIEKEGL